jgi:maleate cis-trans isomerase
VIDYGERLRIGMLVPSGNVIIEPQVNAMLPQGVALYATRLPLRGSSEGELLAMAQNVEEAARLLGHAGVGLIAFNCTAVSTYSKAMEAEIRQRIASATGLPALMTSAAIVEAFGILRARKVVLLTPYIPAVNTREVAFLRGEGLEVLSDTGLGLNTNSEMAMLEPEVWIDLARKRKDSRADAYLVSCTAVRSAEVIDPLELELGRPVLTSNQAITWHCLRTAGIQDRVRGFGALLLEH